MEHSRGTEISGGDNVDSVRAELDSIFDTLESDNSVVAEAHEVGAVSSGAAGDVSTEVIRKPEVSSASPEHDRATEYLRRILQMGQLVVAQRTAHSIED
jgi:hypothetical protein